MPQAIHTLMAAQTNASFKPTERRKRWIGTPGAPNRWALQRSTDREEQVNSDRLPPRRGNNLKVLPAPVEARVQAPAIVPITQLPAGPRIKPGKAGSKPWSAIDQALRVADLLLQAGGFGVIVLDLASIASDAAWRIPLATWFRFRAACERTRISLILLTQHPCARSSAEVVVRLQTGSFSADHRVMTGVEFQAATQRHRSQEQSRVVSICKAPQSAPAGAWRAKAAWA